MTVSLPPEMLRQFEAVRQKESRTRSELVREALRTYFEDRYRTVAPSPVEIAAIQRGRSAFRRGDYVPLNRVLDELETVRDGSRAQAVAKVARKGPRAR
jgi:Arc/MetJ-type ribon-helix-helix transcriptional regulator